MKRPAFWLGIVCLGSALALLLLGRERAVLPGASLSGGSAQAPAPAAPRSRPPADIPSPRPSAAAAPRPEASPPAPGESDFERWQRGDLVGMCGEFPVGGEVYPLLARQRYTEALRLATQKAQAGDVPAMGLLDAYRGLCAAFMQGEALQDFQQREAYLLQGESPESAEQIRAYLKEERSAQERLSQACPEIVGTSDAVASQFATLLHERAQDPQLPPGHRRILARLMDPQEPNFAREQLALAASQGDSGASYELAMYQTEAQNRAEAPPTNPLQALSQAARLGSVEARVELAYCWLNGCSGSPRSTDQALLHLRAAAQSGHPGAMMSLINLLREGNDQLKPKPGEALAWVLNGEHLAARGAFNSASLEMRQEFRSLKEQLLPVLSYSEQEQALAQAKQHTAQTRPAGRLPKECASLALSPPPALQ